MKWHLLEQQQEYPLFLFSHFSQFGLLKNKKMYHVSQGKSTFGDFKDIDVAILHPSAYYIYRIQT